MPVSEYERGLRDGLMLAADLLKKYQEKMEVDTITAEHLNACAEGFEFGVSMRDITSLGEANEEQQL